MISIIIPIYNAERFLRECLDSVISQEYTDLEILLINDGSTDGSFSICIEYESKDSRIKTVTKENGGQMSAWILGVQLSHGEYIGFVDSDDLVDSTMYLKLHDTIVKYNADIVMCGRSVFDKVSCNNEKLLMKDVYSEESMNEIYSAVFPNEGGCISQARWDKLFKREIIISNMNNYCNKCVRTMEDRFIVSSALLSAKVFAIVDEPLYKCRLVANSSSKKARPELYDIAELLYKTQSKMLIDKHMYSKYGSLLSLTRLDYLKMIIIRNISRINNLTLRQKIKIASTMLNDINYRNIVVKSCNKSNTKFGKFIYLAYKLDSALFLVGVSILYGCIFEKSQENYF